MGLQCGTTFKGVVESSLSVSRAAMKNWHFFKLSVTHQWAHQVFNSLAQLDSAPSFINPLMTWSMSIVRWAEIDPNAVEFRGPSLRNKNTISP